MQRAKRNYDNSRRSAQAEATSLRILDALIAILGETELEPSVAQIAERAGVSAPTVYKAFPNRDELYRAMHARVDKGLKLKAPSNTDELRDVVVKLHEFFTQNEALVRVAERAPVLKPVRDVRLANRVKAMTHALRSTLAHLPKARQETVIGVLSLLTGGSGWLVLRDSTSASPQEIVDARLWAFDTLIARLRHDARKAEITPAQAPKKRAQKK